MALQEEARISADAFLAWAATREERFELVDGRIVRMMTGAKQSHNVVTANIVAALLPQARRGGCRTTASDTAVRTSAAGIRYPDVVVDCGPSDPDAIEASCPAMVVEVASPGTSAIDATDKLDEYQSHPDVRLILFVDPDVLSLKLYRRDIEGRWRVEKYGVLDETIPLPEIGGSLAVAEIYATLDPAPGPSLRLVDGPTPR
ncbi:Uma2 family endonuclease [Jiella mangrovi]|uniref:Uma2 family endonuclease n=1 Tax=Jiella mangrovi TaxID=2821407 RepID=A0ABS4BGE9_9HYPH|nr:Uma2 family endonuclease [Jiella mangrovi]MBP0615833.1 Uma2 family endonuclease [Jiella mangrovi]